MLLLIFFLVVAVMVLPFVAVWYISKPTRYDAPKEKKNTPTISTIEHTHSLAPRSSQPPQKQNDALSAFLAEKAEKRTRKGYVTDSELYLPCFKKYDLTTNSLMKRRLKDARSSDTTPLIVDRINKKATFPRSNGDIYHTDLDWCDCRAFDDSCEPCKHIIRLSIELGVIDTPLSTDPPKPPASPRRKRTDIFNPLVAEIEKHPESFPTLHSIFFDYLCNNGYCVIYDLNSVLYCIDSHNLVVKKRDPGRISSSDVHRELLAHHFPFPDDDTNNQFKYMWENRQLTADFLGYITYTSSSSRGKKVYYAPFRAIVSLSGDFKICAYDLLEYLTCRMRSMSHPRDYQKIYLGNNTVSSSLPSYVIDALKIYDPLLRVEK